MLDYPLRAGKAFRPSLCIATCRRLTKPARAALKSGGTFASWGQGVQVILNLSLSGDNRPVLLSAPGAQLARMIVLAREGARNGAWGGFTC